MNTPRGSIELAFTGDVMLGRLVNGAIAERGYAHPWGDILPQLRGADLTLINLECALTSCETPGQDGGTKPFHFRAEPGVVESLRLAGIDFATLANNHACDYGTVGLLDTVRLLDGAEIAHAGAGADLDAARAVARLEAGGFRVAVVSFTDYPLAWAATSDRPGINYTPVSTQPDDFDVVRRQIEQARSEAEVVIFCIHWGPNMRAHPPPAFREFARAVIEAGADIFWGHSAHIVHGVEVHQGRLILYDTGDFVDDYRVDPELRNDRSALFEVVVSCDGPEELRLLPVQIAGEQVNVAAGESRAWFARRFAEQCGALGTDVSDDGERLRVAISVGMRSE